MTTPALSAHEQQAYDALRRLGMTPQAARAAVAAARPPSDPLARAVDHALNRSEDQGAAERQAAREADAQQFARDVAEAWTGHSHLQTPDDLAPGGTTA